MDILRTEKALAAGTGRVLVFVGSKRGADRLRADLAQRVGASSAVVAIHGDLDQARAPYSDAKKAANRTSRVFVWADRKWPLNDGQNTHTFAAYMWPSVRATILQIGLGGRRETAA